MITLRKSSDRGHADHGWLNARHSFSFANYYDPRNMGYRALRVINEDVVQPGKGFGTHAHDNMEILTYVLEGALEHKDSMGNTGVIRPGEVQYMSAGSGVRHSEFNHSKTEPVHLLQIWLLPNQEGVKPQYAESKLPDEERRGKLKLVAAGDPNGSGAFKIHQDVRLFASLLPKGQIVELPLQEGRGAYLQLARGAVSLNGTRLEAGDGAIVEKESMITVTGESEQEAEFLLFDLN
ncbi:MAG TPA: pirin family protein [Terriglobales bacterium]|nr:pirin family protein [Terriglobales bacterium]